MYCLTAPSHTCELAKHITVLQTNVTNGTSVPMAMFNVTKGNRYVFRIIAGTCFTCQYAIGIEKHDMYIIGSDGQPTKPYKVTSLTMSPG